PDGTGLGTFLPTGETTILPARTLVTRSGSSSTQRKGPWRRPCIWESTVWIYASQVFRVCSFNSAPSEAAGEATKPTHTMLVKSLRFMLNIASSSFQETAADIRACRIGAAGSGPVTN